MPPINSFRLPDDPLELVVFLDGIRVRILPLVDLLKVTPDDLEMLRSDFASLNYAVRATEEAEILAGEWLDYQTQLLYGEEEPIYPPAAVFVPRSAAPSRLIIREAQASRRLRIRAGLMARLQTFADRLIAHPNMTDKALLDLGLLGEASVGFSAGQGE